MIYLFINYTYYSKNNKNVHYIYILPWETPYDMTFTVESVLLILTNYCLLLTYDSNHFLFNTCLPSDITTATIMYQMH